MVKQLIAGAGLLTAAWGAGACANRMAPASDHPPNPQIDQFFSHWTRPGSPGCAVGISRNAQVVYERGYGIANLELNVPIPPATVFAAASISKQFTAMSIALLAERGQLSLDDPVRKYLPEMPDYPAGSARAKTLRAYDGSTLSGRFERVEAVTPTLAQLRAYAGRYASDELDVVWTIEVHDSALVIKRIGNADTAIQPLAADMFTTIGDYMRFTRDARGLITGFTLVSGGARGLRFERVVG